jgi:hypothetical protein
MKNFPKRSVFVVALGLLLSYGCKKDEAVVSVDACSANATLVSNAATTFSNSPTKTNCEAYLASLNKYLDSCPGLTTAQRTQYKADIAATKCQ